MRCDNHDTVNTCLLAGQATALEEELTDYSGKLALIKEETKVLTEEELHQQKIDVYAEDERHQVGGTRHVYPLSVDLHLLLCSST
jgi:hypothetical protein